MTTTSNRSAASSSSARPRSITRSPRTSAQPLDRPLRWAPLRRSLLLNRAPQVEQPDRSLPRRDPESREALRLPQDRRSAPVPREAARVGGQKDDVGGAAGRQQVLLVGP